MGLPQTTHVLRVTIRVHVGNFRRETDLSLPATTTFADALPELVELCQAPRITRPWRVTTAAGTTLDMATPLHLLALEHGAVLILSPLEPVDAPIVRDSAEALASLVGGHRGAFGAAQAATVVGILGVVALLTLLLPPAAACAGGAALAVLIVLWLRDAHVVGLSSVALAAAAGTWAVTPTSLSDASWSLVAAVGAGVSVTIVLGALGSLPARAGAAIAVLALTGLVVAAALNLQAPTAVPGAVLLWALLLVLAAPSVATSWVGLRVPVLPTAGQDLSASDIDQPDVEDRATRATRVADGLSLGLLLAGAPAAVAVGWEGSLWAQLTCLAIGGGLLLHAARHSSPIPAWSLTLMGLAALAGAVVAVFGDDPHPGQLILSGVLVTLAVTAVLWAPKVRFLEPTRMVWLERAEMVAIIAALPLLVQMMGVFALIRGLG